MSIKNEGVLYLLRDKFQIYTPFLSSILEVHFVNDIIRDLEIINKELLESILKVFIESNKILPCNLIIVLSNSVCFIQDFAIPEKSLTSPAPSQQSSDQKQEMIKIHNEAQKEMRLHEEKFKEHVPFEIVASQTVPLQNGERIYATNQELYETIKSVFETKGFTIDSVLPGDLFGNNLGTQPALTPAAVALVIQSAPALKKHSMLVQSARESVMKDEEKVADEKAPAEITDPEILEERKSKSDKKRLIILSGVFGLLIIILIVVYIFSSQSGKSPSNRTQPVSTVQTIKQKKLP